MARVGEEFPLECPGCGGDIRLIAFITDPGPIRKILAHLGEPLEPPPVSPARGPPAAYHRETLIKRLADVPWQEEPWKSRYPELSGLDRCRRGGASRGLLPGGLGPVADGPRSGTRGRVAFVRQHGRCGTQRDHLDVWHDLPRRGRQRRAGDLDDQSRGERRFGEPPPDGRSPRGSRVARQQQDRCRSAFERAILRHNSAR